jgi:omega-6 fatty acid desaturase (delta-12 desaturase)
MGGQNADAVAGTTGASGWTKVLARYRSPNSLRSLIEIVITIGPFALLWALAWLGLYLGYWFSLLLVIPVVHDPARLRPRLILSQPRAE